jgi:hypothetical protein
VTSQEGLSSVELVVLVQQYTPTYNYLPQRGWLEVITEICIKGSIDSHVTIWREVHTCRHTHVTIP